MFKAIEGGKDNTNTTYELESQGSFVIDENYLDNLFKSNEETINTLMEDKTMSKETVNTTTTITNIEGNTSKENKTAKIGRKPAPATVTKTESTEVKPTEEAIKTPIVIPDDYDIASVSMSNKTYSAERLTKDISKNKAIFDNAVQRSDVWTIQQKSALITSMILGLPIPNMYANRNEEGVLDFLDGKQRSHAISDFMNDNFPLTDVDPITIVCKDDEKEIDINGYKFSELPEIFKHAIQTYELHIVVFDNIDEDIANDIFDRLNSGTALTAIEKSRVKAVSLEQIQTLAKHEVFSTLSDKALRKYTDEDLVTKMLKICFDSDKSLDTKEVRPYMRSVIITEDMSKTITALLDRIYKVYTELNNNTEVDESLKKKYKSIARKMVTRTHLVTLVGFLYTHKSVTNEMLKKLVCTVFYGTNDTKAKYNKYFANATSGAGHRTAVEARLECLDEIVSELTK